MNSRSTKAGKSHQKDVIRCQKLSSTSNNSQKSCSRSSASDKPKMKVISKSNKEPASALQDTRYDLANQERLLKNMMSARIMMLKMHSSMKSFMKDFDQVLFLLNTDDTKRTVLPCSLQPQNEFKNKMKNKIKSVKETSDPESSILKPGVTTENTGMIVEEIAAKTVTISKGTAEESMRQCSTLKKLPNTEIEKTVRKRKHLTSQSNNSVHKPASKRSKKSTVDEQSEEGSNDQNPRNSFRKSKKEKTLRSKREERSSERKSSATESQTEEPRSTPTSVKSVGKQRKGQLLRQGLSTEESTASEFEIEKYRLKNPTSVKRQKSQIQADSYFQDETKSAVSKNSGTARRERRGGQRALSVDDATQNETFKSENETSLNQLNVSEMEDQQIEQGSNDQNLKISFKKSKKKETLQNEREEKDNPEKFGAEKSQNEEPMSSLNSIKSVRRQRRGSQEKSTVDEAQNKELVIENSTSIKKGKRRGQIESKKAVNRNTETSRGGSSRQRAIIADDASEERTLISENKMSLNELSVVCYDVLIHPIFESDPFVSKFKKDNIFNCDSSRNDEDSAEGDTYEILDEIDEEQESSENLEGEEENQDTEGINDSSKQASSPPHELVHSDSAESKTALSIDSGTSRNDRQRVLGVDASPDETSFNQLNVSEKEATHSTIDGHSGLASDDNLDSVGVDQENKPEKESNEDEADLNGNKVGEAKSNADEIEAIDADSKDKEEFIENESETSVVKENADEQGSANNPAGNHCTSSSLSDRTPLEKYPT